MNDRVKENAVPRPPLSTWWLCAGLAATAAALGVVALVDRALPEPLTRRTAPPERFIAEIAREHLVNLTSLGPRVAGSYENEVLAVALLTEAVRRIAREAGAHNRVEVDVQTASGAFEVAFLDGMSNVYRGVRSVVARVGGAGGRARSARSPTTVLVNCHYDTVPDSPGASDDGAGCAVALEVLRALAASQQPLRHDVIVLLNGAEENIMQASHAFITRHAWAQSVRTFVNLEACGAGGREVLFQAGPRDGWLVEAYAAAAPHPYASSLAQEIFESGAVPADTDFRIFRDFGRLSGVDLAWSANGYVYHTHLDSAERVPAAALQRAGDNVLALVRAALAGGHLETKAAASDRPPLYFDVLGAGVVLAREPLAALLASAAVALLLLKLRLDAAAAARHLYAPSRWWWRRLLRAAASCVAAHCAGVAAAVATAAAIHSLRRRLLFYAQPLVVLPLYAAPALATAWWLVLRAARDRAGPAAADRGGWAWRRWSGVVAGGWGAALVACAVLRLRSGFVPFLWVLPGVADALLASAGARVRTRAVGWCVAAALPLMQTCYLAVGSLQMFIPVTGRSGPAPADLPVAALVAVLALAICSWLLPFVPVARRASAVVYGLSGVWAATVALGAAGFLPAPYSDEAPQRLMVFHVRRVERGVPSYLYWVPHLDANTEHSLAVLGPPLSSARVGSDAECARRLQCGAPYFLPVSSLVPRGHWAPAPSAPLVRMLVDAAASSASYASVRLLRLRLLAPRASHAVVVVAPPAGARLVRYETPVGGGVPLEGPSWDSRRTYFLALHSADNWADWRLTLTLLGPEGRTRIAAAAHAMSGPAKRHRTHSRLLEELPSWMAGTGWGVDLHLLQL